MLHVSNLDTHQSMVIDYATSNSHQNRYSSNQAMEAYSPMDSKNDDNFYKMRKDSRDNAIEYWQPKDKSVI